MSSQHIVVATRLRHVKLFKVMNLSMIQKVGNGIETIPIRCFVTIKSWEGDYIYVSEVQNAQSHQVAFTELPKAGFTNTHIIFSIVCAIPERLLDDARPIWCVLSEYKLQLSTLQKIHADSIFHDINVPVFEMADGMYTLPNIRIQENATKIFQEDHKLIPSARSVKKSINYKSLMRLNKLLKYSSHLKQEKQSYLVNIGNLLETNQAGESYKGFKIKEGVEKVQDSIFEKQNSLDSLRRQVRQIASEKSVLQKYNWLQYNDEYGHLYASVVRLRNGLRVFRNRKLSQLLNIFRSTSLFAYIEVKEDFSMAGSEAFLTTVSLKLLDKSELLNKAASSPEDREEINGLLGYYAFFIHLISTKILDLTLPYSLLYYGSTSIVDNTLPLYLIDYATPKHIESFSKAIDCINGNIYRLQQYLQSSL